MSVRGIVILLLGAAGGFCRAEGPATATNRVELDEVVVTASRSPAAKGAAPVTDVDWFSRRLSEPNFSIDEALRRVPGVFVQNSYNFAQDQRIAIRGFGTRAAFGVREVKLIVDGLPESSPDGQTQLDNLDLADVRRIEVLRGPAAALYGNASGGVVQLFTDRPDAAARPFVETRVTGGSHGFRRIQVRAGGAFDRLSHRWNAHWSDYAGYRRHGAAENRFVSGRLVQELDSRTELELRFNQVDSPWSQDAGGLTAAEVAADRRQARARNVALDAGEKVRQGRLAWVLRRSTDAGHEIEVSQFGLRREFENRLPIVPAAGYGVVEFERSGFGGGARFTGEWERHRVVAGIDAEFQRDDRRRFANVGGTRGALGLEQDETVAGIGPYVREEIRFTDRVSLTGGLRHDRVRFSAADRFLADGDDSGARTLDQFNWAVQADVQLRTNLQVRAGVSSAFQTPTTTELANPNGGGGFNPDIAPQTARNYEVDLRYRPASWLDVSLALFWLDIADELIGFTSPSGRDFFRNAGRSERRGAELGLELELGGGWRWSAAYTAMTARYRDYETAGGDFGGNREPGIPAHGLFTELRWRSGAGTSLSLDAQFVDRFFVNDANTALNSGYTLVNARVGHSFETRAGRLTPFVALNNLLNRRYNGQTRLNAFGGRFFEPAPRFNAFGGLAWRWEF